MSFPYTPNFGDEKMESLHTQHDYLNLLRLRHLQWLNDTEDADTKKMHSEVAELIEKMNDRYNYLLASLQQQKASRDLNKD